MVNLSLFLTLAFVLIMISYARTLEGPYNTRLVGIFVLGLAIELLSWVLREIGWETVQPWLGSLAGIIVGIGFLVLIWQKFKEGQKEG